MPEHPESGLRLTERNHPRRLAILALILLGVCIYCIRLATIAPMQTAEDSQERDSSLTAANASIAQSEALQTAIDTMAQVRHRHDAPASGPNAPASGSNGHTWSARTTRNSTDLALLVLGGQYDAEILARHSLLNPSDLQLTEAQWADLVTLVAELKRAHAPVMEQMARIAAADRIMIVETGVVTPIEEAVPSDQDIRAAAERLATTSLQHGTPLTVADAEALLRTGKATSVRLTGGQLLHGGRRFNNSQFASLPEYDALFEGWRVVAAEEAGAIIGWFLVQGLTTLTSDLTGVISRIDQISPRTLDSPLTRSR